MHSNVVTELIRVVYFYNPGRRRLRRLLVRRKSAPCRITVWVAKGLSLRANPRHLPCLYIRATSRGGRRNLHGGGGGRAIAVASGTPILPSAAPYRSLTLCCENLELDGQTHVVDVREFWTHLQRRFAGNTSVILLRKGRLFACPRMGPFGVKRTYPSPRHCAPPRHRQGHGVQAGGSIDEIVRGELL